jgi:hypothetical protein
MGNELEVKLVGIGCKGLNSEDDKSWTLWRGGDYLRADLLHGYVSGGDLVGFDT